VRSWAEWEEAERADRGAAMDARSWIESWPVYRQLTQRDRLGLGAAVKSKRSERLEPRVRSADKVVKSVCPYCAVGCGQEVYVEGGRVTQIEGDPHSPVSRGRLCPKGSASLQLTTGDARQYRVRYRRPFGTEWEDLDLDTAMDMIADRVVDTRSRTWQDTDDEGRVLNRTLGLAHLGGATLDNEENYLLKKLYTALGAVQVENQARI
jgi:formate dehydrogenase major subunit